MWTDQYRRIPIKSFKSFSFPWLRLNINNLTGCPVNSYQMTFLPFGIHNIWITRFCGRLVAIGEKNDRPIFVGNALTIVVAHRSTMGTIVLCSSVNGVKRRSIIYSNFVILCEWQVGNKAPVFGQVMTLVNTTIRTNKQVVRVVFTESNGVVI